jgi:MoxR-like ATPase
MADGDRGLTVQEASDIAFGVVERIEEGVVLDRTVSHAMLASVVARGHVLLEDVPGTGKTVLGRVLAEALGLEFSRIQFTPDLLPADVTGSNVYNEHDREFEFAPGPIFGNVVLADEINRAPPKTQAALLEAMEERQVTVDGTTHDLPEPFFVIATQNPIEQEGTFRLPEAQRDRFNVKTSMGYPSVEGEMGLLERRANRRSLAPSVDPATDAGTVLALQELAESVRVDTAVRRYIVDLARATRRDDRSQVGVSPRGVQRVFEMVRASAVLAARDYVTPDDVKQLAPRTMAHRIVLTTDASVDGVDPERIVEDALETVDVPAVSPGAPGTDSRDESRVATEATTDGDPGHTEQTEDRDDDQADDPDGRRPADDPAGGERGPDERPGDGVDPAGRRDE